MGDSETTKKSISEVRPKLKIAAPLTYGLCCGYVVTNIIIGFGMIFFYHANPPLSVANLLSYTVWGLIFIALGLLIGYGLIKNNWKLTKDVLLAGIIVKSFWATALIILCIQAPETIIIAAIWGFLLYVQSMTYIHFVPNTPLADRVAMGDEDAA